MTTRQFEKFKVEDQVFSIRFDSEQSMFFCVAFDERVEDESVKGLREKLQVLYDQRKKTTWEPVIEIEITTNSFSYGDSPGFEAELKFLGTVTLPDGTEKKIIAEANTIDMYGDDKDISNYQPIEPFSTYWPDLETRKYIPYSLKRLEALKHIRRQLEKLKSQIQEMLSSGKCESFLENLSNTTIPQLEYKKEEKG